MDHWRRHSVGIPRPSEGSPPHQTLRPLCQAFDAPQSDWWREPGISLRREAVRELTACDFAQVVDTRGLRDIEGSFAKLRCSKFLHRKPNLKQKCDNTISATTLRRFVPRTPSWKTPLQRSRKEPKYPIELAQPLPALELRAKTFTDMRLFMTRSCFNLPKKISRIQGSRWARACFIGPERGVFTMEASDTEKEKRRVSTVVAYAFVFLAAEQPWHPRFKTYKV